MSDHDPTDLVGQERKRRDIEARERIEAEQEVEDVKWLMGNRQGRRIVWRTLSRAGVYRSSFNTNAMAMAFAEGARNTGLEMLALVNRHCPKLYTVMVKENADGRGHADSRNDH